MALFRSINYGISAWESDEKSFRAANIAEPICVFVLDHFAYELRAALAEPLERFVDIVHGEHDP